MRILVTGGAGFIGKHLVRELLRNNHTVTIFDNFSNSTKKSFSSLFQHNVKIIEGDITKFSDILNATKNTDIVIHLAAKISVPESIKNPTETFRVNIDGTKNVLVSCEKNHVKKIVVASSAAVYGEVINKVKLNEKSKLNPISPYGESKMKMEEEVRRFERKNDIDCIILRFFNIYGIGQTSEYAGVISKFLEKIRQEKHLEIFGDGLQTRDFIAIDDVIGAILKSMSDGKSGTYNIASGKSTTINELAEFMVLISGKDLEIRHLTPLKGDIRNSQADISLAKKDLGFSPKYELEKIKEFFK